MPLITQEELEELFRKWEQPGSLEAPEGEEDANAHDCLDMPVSGAKPKADRSQVRHRIAPVHDWTEVEDVPYAKAPKLPTRNTRVSWADAGRVRWVAVSKTSDVPKGWKPLYVRD